VIKIRYSTELGPGLNGQAERCGRGTVVHLLPGLTSVQRSATLRRLSQQGRVGIGPRLPAVQLALALLADRLSTALARVGAVVRIHPAGSTVPVLVLSAAALTFLFVSPVSFRIVHQPQAAGGGSAFGAAPAGAGQPSSASSKQPASGGGAGSPVAGRPGNGTVPAPATDPGPGYRIKPQRRSDHRRWRHHADQHRGHDDAGASHPATCHPAAGGVAGPDGRPAFAAGDTGTDRVGRGHQAGQPVVS
jgi:hypothetical protein